MFALISGSTVAMVELMEASLFRLAASLDYGVVFGAFAGAVFYVSTAVKISRWRLVGYFFTSFTVGVLGAGLVGARLADWTGYRERPLDALGAVLLSALIVKVLTFFNRQGLSGLFSHFTGLGGNDGR